MRSGIVPSILCTAFFFGLGVSGASALGEEKITIGGKTGWGLIAGMESLTRLQRIRPREVLALSSKSVKNADIIDMELSFDEANGKFNDTSGNYALIRGSHVQSAKEGWARHGAGAAFFPGTLVVTTASNGASSGTGTAATNAVLSIRAANNRALFSAGRNLEDFSIEFWLYPVTLESGERIFAWNAALPALGQQTILCRAVKNRLVWDFDNFFTSAGNENAIHVSLGAKTAIAPKIWSHHKVRFDALSGSLEYFANGVLEDIVYTRRQGTPHSGGILNGEIYMPLVGERGSFSLGERYNGLLDEFIIKGRDNPDDDSVGFTGTDAAYIDMDEKAPPRYKSEGGSFRTRPLQTSEFESAILQINVKGGKLRSGGTRNSSGAAVLTEQRTSGDFKFEGGAQIAFFVRYSDDAFMLKWEQWTSFTPGKALQNVNGRFVEIMANFYPSGDNEESPFIEELEIVYLPGKRPSPPVNIVAVAENGAVTLRWKPPAGDGAPAGAVSGVKPADIGGYLVYYGSASGEYLGIGSRAGDSPVDAGLANSVRIDNLTNGALYYFSVAAYPKAGAAYPGNFSKEVSARPLSTELYD